MKETFAMELLKVGAIVMWGMGGLLGLYGWVKEKGLRREDFRWDIDMEKARREMRERNLHAMATAFGLGIMLAILYGIV